MPSQIPHIPATTATCSQLLTLLRARQVHACQCTAAALVQAGPRWRAAAPPPTRTLQALQASPPPRTMFCVSSSRDTSWPCAAPRSAVRVTVHMLGNVQTAKVREGRCGNRLSIVLQTMLQLMPAP